MIDITPVPLNRINSPNNLLQSRLWGLAKRSPGIRTLAFESTVAGSVLVLLYQIDSENSYALVPWGPEVPPQSQNGLFLESFSESVRPHLPGSCLFIRYDLPWPSPWNDREDGPPAPSTRELEMNFGTRHHRLRKAPTDMQPVDTLIVNLDDTEEHILAGMKQKTRYNIGLARRRGVRVHPASPDRLDQWFALYRQTMERHGKTVHRFDHFRRLFEAVRKTSVAAARPGAPIHRHNIRLLLAERDGETLAGMVLAVSGDYAIYLYGASGSQDRRAMPTYLLQWKAMETARRLGARRYDMFGIPPDRREGHPMHGLLRFKEGFGGQHISRRGCWDYPYRMDDYLTFAGREGADKGYHRR
jgi:lipid II:glycine glycyltransferase (peptidoglycan interpeptide bridge formation enzyme)